MGVTRQELIVNLSGPQKKVLGFATWLQVSISAAGLIIGSIIYTILNNILTAIGVSSGTAIVFSAMFFVATVVPFAVIAFKPIRDKQGDLLYYEDTQLLINYRFLRREVGTYINIQPNRHFVNERLPYFKQHPID
ncbi:Uncharacterized protein JF73_17690 (plasmid) [Lactobacillus helsingborgensis]|uniref:Uncharacterized protein n=2 Tax=Lactobacillus TaxID=1578 RepID=A0AA47B5Q8_9LACO|nr:MULTISPECIES: hypothetical protein [Lactobacillus]KJY54754.1 Uncharacterized protein JF74_19350 [Lactobacillus melliventris]KJY60591.1 Uncharacterized protein JF73_17690 [Lactobacillus helsingborgensis]UZX30636.1 hypothetical protein LDX53_09120 [Lactobacillus helsingborgensis]UZX32433.1 hypothetical protein LDX52_09685 [Lactobacillus helsingborgensis]